MPSIDDQRFEQSTPYGLDRFSILEFSILSKLFIILDDVESQRRVSLFRWEQLLAVQTQRTLRKALRVFQDWNVL